MTTKKTPRDERQDAPTLNANTAGVLVWAIPAIAALPKGHTLVTLDLQAQTRMRLVGLNHVALVRTAAPKIRVETAILEHPERGIHDEPGPTFIRSTYDVRTNSQGQPVLEFVRALRNGKPCGDPRKMNGLNAEGE